MFNGCFQKEYLGILCHSNCVKVETAAPSSCELILFSTEVASLTYHACNLPQPEMSLVPLIVVTAIVEICFFAIRVWVMRKKGHSRGYDDITISIAFVSGPAGLE